MLGIAEDRVAIEQVMIVEPVTAECEGCPSPPALVHVAIEETVVTLLQVPLLGHNR
jgi:hypothetical protein